jgi:uncharacterized membrane protein YfcA
MLAATLIAISFSLGFFVESIIGFGGGLIAYSILGFFLDLKEMILAGLYIGTLSSAYIVSTDFKSFNQKILQKIAPISLLGTILGVVIFSHFSSQILSITFGVLLVLLSIKTMFFDDFIFPKFLQKNLLLIGGISQGAFGIGGPFVANALKNDFQNKSEFRATMAMFFVVFNLVRVAQLGFHGELKLDFFTQIWWCPIPIFCAIKLGHLVHLKISEDIFKKGIALMTIFAGLKFLL